MNTDPRLPRADDEERWLLSCLLDWPEYAGCVLPLCKPADFFHEQHQNIWRLFSTQYQLRGCIDRLAVGRELDCCDYLLELTEGAPTTVHAEHKAEAVKLAARGRRLHEVLTKAANAILRGRPADAVLAQVQLALEAFEQEAVA